MRRASASITPSHIFCFLAGTCLSFLAGLTPQKNAAVATRSIVGIPCNQNSTLLELSYPAPVFYPVPRFRMVLEAKAGHCHYLPNNACNNFSRGELEWPEAFVVQVLIAFLADCWSRPCFVADFGGNLGYVNSYAAALGATVVSIEPQQDLHAANVRTVELNCWQERVHLVNGMVTLNETEHGERASLRNLWRPGMLSYHREHITTKHYISSIFGKLRSKEIDLVKIDVDSIDRKILAWLTDQIAAKALIVHTIIIEYSGDALNFWKLQQFGYSVYQLDHHMRLRFFDQQGRDVYKLRGLALELRYREEYFCRRGIQYLHRFSNFTLGEWQKALSVVLNGRGHGWETRATSWLLTDVELRTPAVMESWSKSMPPVLQGSYRNADPSISSSETINPIPQCSHGSDPISTHAKKHEGMSKH